MARVVEFFDEVRTRLEPRLHEVKFLRSRRRSARHPAELEPHPTVSMVCVSNRPNQLSHIVLTWRSQVRVDAELVLVTNADGYAPVAHELLGAEPGVTIVETDPTVTLGAALNRGIEASSGSVVAKIDDDDFYAPDYLHVGVELLRRTKAGVIGKKAHFVYLAATDQTILRFPLAEHRRVGRVAGGTLIMHRQVASEVKFDDVNVGEDTTFVRSVERSGWAVVAGGAAGYLQMRADAHVHTWQPTSDQLMARSRFIGLGLQDSYWQSPR